jgi:hypothetical protein
MPRALIVAVLLAAFLATPAPAQIDTGVIADPISRDDLDDWAARLELSDAQIDALDGLYAEYIRQHGVLRDGDLATFLRDHEDYGNSTTEITTDADAARETMRELRELHGRMRRLDEQLIDRLGTVLTEEQLPRLGQVRAGRERDRLLGGPAQRSYHPALDLDLGVQYRELAAALDDDTRQRTDPIVDLYERTLTGKAREIDRFALRYELGMAEGYGAASAESGPEANDFALRAMQVRHWQTELADRAGDIGDLHRRLVKDLSAWLDEPAREAMREHLIRGMYAQVPAKRGLAEDAYDRVLAHEAASAELKEAVRSERAAYVQAADRVVEQMLDTIDAERRSNASHSLKMMFGDEDPYVYEDPAEYERARRRLHADLARVNRDAIDRLQALADASLGERLAFERPAVMADVADLLEGGLHSSISTSDGEVTYGYKHIPLTMLTRQFGTGRPAIAPISSRDLLRWRRRLDLDDGDATIMDVVHGDYLERFDALRTAGALASVKAAREAMLALDDDGRPIMPTEADVRTLCSLERAAVDAVRRLDEWFFEELALALGDALAPEAREAIARDRSRTIYLAVSPPEGYALFVFGEARNRHDRGGEQSGVDVTSIVGDLDLDDDAREATGAILVDYERAATDVLRRAYDAVCRFDEERAVFMARHLRFDEEDGLVARNMQLDTALEDAGSGMHDVLDELLALNRQARVAVRDVLPSPGREAFEAAYKRAAWPAIYRDEHALHDALASALAVEELDALQRDAIAELSLNYRGVYEELSDRMIETAGDWQEQRRFSFQRSELSQHTRDRLRQLLGEELARRVENLDEPGGG